jgi:phosphate starvation-inducible protein PhoH and related proteins
MAKSKKSGEGSVEIGSMERKIEFKPRKFKFSEKQKQLLDVCLNPETKAIFITGPAGSSKTYMAVYAALNLLAINKDWDMTYIRSLAESADRGIGSLPGTVEEKFMPFLIPLEDKMDEIITAPTMVNLRKEQIINVLPVNFVRGSSWVNKVVICDEAQNFSRKELITLVTRIGEQSKIFICGDLMQSDIRSSGFNEFINLFDDEESRAKGIHVFKFDKEDIYRSEILKFIVEKLEQLGKKV